MKIIAAAKRQPQLKSAFKLLTAVCALIFAAPCPSAPAAHPNKQDGSGAVPALELTQKHEFFDDCILTVSPIGIRLHNKSAMGFELVSTPPSWTTVVYRNDDKTFHSMSFANLQNSSLWPESVSKTYDNIWMPTKERDITFRSMPAKQISTGVRFLEYLPMPGEMSPGTNAVLHKIYKVPTNKGIPLQFWKIHDGKEFGLSPDFSGHKQSLLSTSAIRKTVVNQAMFKVPDGYKETPSMQEVLMSKEARHSAEDMDVLFDIGKAKGSRRR